MMPGSAPSPFLTKASRSRPKSLDLVQAKYRLVLGSQGQKAAVAFVEEAAKSEPEGPIARVLADVYRDQGDLDSAEKTLERLVLKEPEGPQACHGVCASDGDAGDPRSRPCRTRSRTDLHG